MQGGLPAGLHESDTASASEPVTDSSVTSVWLIVEFRIPGIMTRSYKLPKEKNGTHTKD